MLVYLKSPLDIFNCLSKLYGRDPRDVIKNTIQLPQESVKLFISRFQINMRSIGIRLSVLNKVNT